MASGMHVTLFHWQERHSLAVGNYSGMVASTPYVAANAMIGRNSPYLGRLHLARNADLRLFYHIWRFARKWAE